MNNEETLRRLVGENQEDYDKKLQNRMERRRQRMAEGINSILLLFFVNVHSFTL